MTCLADHQKTVVGGSEAARCGCARTPKLRLVPALLQFQSQRCLASKSVIITCAPR